MRLERAKEQLQSCSSPMSLPPALISLQSSPRSPVGTSSLKTREAWERDARGGPPSLSSRLSKKLDLTVVYSGRRQEVGPRKRTASEARLPSSFPPHAPGFWGRRRWKPRSLPTTKESGASVPHVRSHSRPTSGTIPRRALLRSGGVGGAERNKD